MMLQFSQAPITVKSDNKMPLSDLQIKASKPQEKDYKLSDNKGMYLLVAKTGGKHFKLKYRFNDKEKKLSLGEYPITTLAEAREAALAAKKLLAKGIDPSEAKKEAVAAIKFASGNTFESIAREWHSLHNKNKSERHKNRVARWLEYYLFPTLGKKAISTITAPQILEATKDVVKEGKLETAHRLIQTVGQVFRYAIQRGFADSNPAPDLKGALPPPTVKHMAAFIEPSDFAGLLRAIEGYSGGVVVESALKIAPMVFQRIGELRHMRWSDLDFERAEWRYLVSKTKTEHIVPLSTQAVAIIENLKEFTGHLPYVFAGGRDPQRPMSENAINAALRRMGYDTQTEITGHGFRAIAQTLGEQELGLEAKHIERQLAHSVANPLGTAYERSQFLRDRKIMMQKWADYLDELKAGAKVISIKQGA